MDEQKLIVSISLKYVKVRSLQEVTNRSIDKASVPTKIVKRKNHKEKEIENKTLDASKRRPKNKATDEERKVSSTIVSDNTNNSKLKNPSGQSRKRKSTVEEKSKNGTEREIENNTSEENKNTKSIEEENDSMKRPKTENRGRKKKSENTVVQNTDDDPNAVDGNTRRNFKENKKNSSTKPPKRKTAEKEKSENIVDQNSDDDTNTLDGYTRRQIKEKKSGGVKKYKKKIILPTISEMLLESEAWRLLMKPIGTSFEEISKIVAEKYQVEINRIKPLVESFYQREIANGWCEKINSSGDEEKFKATNILYFSYKINDL